MTEWDGMGTLFGFERDFNPDLKCIPMVVRYKLDLVGLKVTLTAWNRLPLAARKQLLTEWPIRTAEERTELRGWLINWLRTTSTHPPRECQLENPAWDDPARIPEVVSEAAAGCEPPLDQPEWAALNLLQRVALVKLARSLHERERVPRALEEFRSLPK